MRVLMHGWWLCSSRQDDEPQAMSAARPQISTVRPVIGACVHVYSYTHIPPSLLWSCGWLALLALAATLKPSVWYFSICAMCGFVCSVICRRDLPQLRAACWPLNDALHSISILLPLPFPCCLLWRGEGSLQSMAFFSSVSAKTFRRQIQWNVDWF